MLSPSTQRTMQCPPWCAEHSAMLCRSDRHRADIGYARLVRSPIDGQTRILVSVSHPKRPSQDGIIQLSAHDARDLADLFRALGQLQLSKAVKLTVHEAEAFSQF